MRNNCARSNSHSTITTAQHVTSSFNAKIVIKFTFNRHYILIFIDRNIAFKALLIVNHVANWQNANRARIIDDIVKIIRKIYWSTENRFFCGFIEWFQWEFVVHFYEWIRLNWKISWKLMMCGGNEDFEMTNLIFGSKSGRKWWKNVKKSLKERQNDLKR